MPATQPRDNPGAESQQGGARRALKPASHPYCLMDEERNKEGRARARARQRSVWEEEGRRRQVSVASVRSCPRALGLDSLGLVTLSHPHVLHHTSCLPPTSLAQRPPLVLHDLLSSLNGATPALKLGSTVLTVHDSWDFPPIVRFTALRSSTSSVSRPYTGRTLEVCPFCSCVSSLTASHALGTLVLVALPLRSP